MAAWSRISFDADKARVALERVLVDGKCPISGHRAWAIAPGFVELRPVVAFSPISAPITSGRIAISGTSSGTSPETIFSYTSAAPGTGGGGGWYPHEEHTYPAVMATCKGCGFVALFNAVVLGLVPREQEATEGWHTPPERQING